MKVNEINLIDPNSNYYYDEDGRLYWRLPGDIIKYDWKSPTYDFKVGVDEFVYCTQLTYFLKSYLDMESFDWDMYPSGPSQWYYDRILMGWTDTSQRPRYSCSNECPNHLKEVGFRNISAGYGNDKKSKLGLHFCCNSCAAKFRELNYNLYPEYSKLINLGGGWGLQHSDPSKYKSVNQWNSSDNSKYNYESFIQGYGISSVVRLPRLNIVIRVRSNLERSHLESIDLNNDIIDVKYESLSIKYSYENIEYYYIPDLLITKSDNTKILVEIKPESKRSDPVNQAKFKAAEKYCLERGWKFEVWTEYDL